MPIKTTLPGEVIVSKIFLIRNSKVMIDRDLAELYGVETKVLKQAVRRNIDRFPIDFMFEMNIMIIRIFTKLREMLLTHKDLLLKVEQLETRLASHDENIAIIFRYLKELLNPPSEPMRKIGFKKTAKN